MSFNLYINKKKKPQYQRKFFIQNIKTEKIPYQGMIYEKEQNKFRIEKLNILNLFKEETKLPHEYSLKAKLFYFDKKTIVEIVDNELIVDTTPFETFIKVERITPSIEQILNDASFEKNNPFGRNNLKKFGQFLIRKGILLKR